MKLADLVDKLLEFQDQGYSDCGIFVHDCSDDKCQRKDYLDIYDVTVDFYKSVTTILVN